MDLQSALNFAPAFALAFFRMSGLMIMSPLFGSTRIPKRMKLMFASIATLGSMGAIGQPISFPDNLPMLTFAIAGEIAFGLAMGMVVSFTFISAQWAGEMIGQQMGFNLSEVFDPQFGQAGSLVGDLYFMLTLVVFLGIGGHRTMLEAVHNSFVSVPLLSLGFNADLLDTVLNMLTTATVLALRLAAPMFFTMLVVDLALGTMGKAMPQLNIMTAGLSIRAIVGIVVLLVGVTLTSDTLQASLESSLEEAVTYWQEGTTHGG